MTSPTLKLNNNETNVEEKFDRETILISITFLIIIILLALFGNVLVVIAFRVFQNLRNMTNYFIVSLAVADILVAAISMPVWGAYIITGPEWKFDIWVEQVSLTILFFFSYSLIITCSFSNFLMLASSVSGRNFFLEFFFFFAAMSLKMLASPRFWRVKAQAAQAPAVTWSSCTITVTAEL